MVKLEDADVLDERDDVEMLKDFRYSLYIQPLVLTSIGKCLQSSI